MRARLIVLLLLQGPLVATWAQNKNSIGMQLVPIEAGRFYMGSEREGKDYDESPVHRVSLSKPFLMSATEVTNAQYEAFDPAHRKIRGKNGFSTQDDEAVVFVSYREATAFCDWLSQKEGKFYRLPTEAEWEYACRAGTISDFSTGSSLPGVYQKNQSTNRNTAVVSLKVGQTPANPWGLFDMHGNVEEWCLDWYGPYQAGPQQDPVGTASGLYRISRGGSFGTPVSFLRSANRSAMIPEDKNWLVGFRVVQAPLPATNPSSVKTAAYGSPVSQKRYSWKPADAEKPIFREPQRYINKPDCTHPIPFYSHNHQPAVTWCPNGDLLTIWFSTDEESGREMTVLSSRLRAGASTWDEPTEFFKVPDRNMTGASLLHDGKGTLYHLNGVETDGDWQDLAMVLRTSTDNGVSWTTPRLINPEHTKRNQVIAGLSQTKEGWLIQPADADPGPSGGTAIHVSRDGGKTWVNPYTDPQTPGFGAGETGGLIAGIHAGVVQLKNGDLLALGRKNDIQAPDNSGLRMPMSRSADMGKTWTYSPSPFPPVWSGQRLVLTRLNEGALLLVSFTHHPDERTEKLAGMTFQSADGNPYKGYGMYAAVSFDEGKTWPVVKLLTDGKERYLNGGAWTGAFETDQTHAEPKGYLAVTQTPDNVIHLLSSSLHYQFNLAWLNQRPMAPAGK
ncbi:SUMF1/EgtB/PvdO family nonheme iron enzyme [Siphonobacter aquaeclarae]|uniref:Formylglycine-generating enzyme, required for sulfatase activity, contains SUMF1/FGE domain n=1 Tax=Siphonobacter aquaeclarae TaxID=563176 RepID=A0A1G9JRB2_9BACT|nr:SUMF1/EgtB/PvdO family nonheme iron enzyme [Siphonobacter aquaeclarae]SDL39892.1 Formylglycine-generating enzyme, required for sulfatase activity, contains SUMF1/FGE domain [Siphonobacter aquaeclarae]